MLSQFLLKNFKCFHKILLEDCARINLITGKNNSGKTALLEALLSSDLSNHKTIFFSNYHQFSNDELIESFNLILLNNKLEQIVNIFQRLDDSILEIKITDDSNISVRMKEQTFLPISSFGHFFNRVFGIILQMINNPNSICLIDEIENSIHYQNQRILWQILFELTIELNIQIFTTTHSLEMIKSFVDIGLEFPNQGTYYELVRNIKTNQITVIKRDLDGLQYSLKHEMGIGLRGE